MADEIKWNIVGREELMDREAVIDRCDKSAKFLETVSATLAKLNINPQRRLSLWKARRNFQIGKIKPQAWPAVVSFNFRMGDLLKLHHPSMS